jgi:ssDNA-binding Zn-finger/Zn-ribbon topoisomerase 1
MIKEVKCEAVKVYQYCDNCNTRLVHIKTKSRIFRLDDHYYKCTTCLKVSIFNVLYPYGLIREI